MELRPYEELEQRFRVENVNTSPAFFDVKKLTAFNGEYIRALSSEAFVQACERWLMAPAAPWPAEAFDPAVFAVVASLAQSRLTVLSEITTYVNFLFLAEPTFDEDSWNKAMKAGAAELLRDARATLESSEWAAELLKPAMEEVAARHGLKLGKAQAPVRVAVMGRTVGLPLFESLEVLGRERVLARLDAALRRLAAQ